MFHSGKCRLHWAGTGLGALVLAVVSVPAVRAATHSIDNGQLAVSYDPSSGTFTVADKAVGAVFLKEGRLEGSATMVLVETATDPTFGSGKRIVVGRADGGSSSLELYQKLPFVLIRGQLHNNTKENIDVSKVVPATFTLDLGKPAAELRTMGSDGLTAPDKHPGSYLFLTLADPATRRGVVAGWLTQDRGSGVVFSGIKDGQVGFRAQLDHGHLQIAAGQSATLETLAIGLFDDARLGQEQYADAIARQYKIHLRPQVAGYCTWYSDRNSGAGDEKSIVELAGFAAKELKPFGFGFVQIDDKWQDGGNFNGPTRGFERVAPGGGYAHGMKPVAEKIQQLGLSTGIWFMPFARNYQDPEYKDRQHWFVQRDNGKPYETDWGGTSLDLTQPEVKAHLVQLIKTIHGWGYNYFKMDGLWTGTATEQIYVNDGYHDDHIGNNAPFHDPAKTNIEAYRDGLKLLRQAAGPDVFFSGCNVSQNMRSLGGSLGLLDSMRIGPDNGTNWKGLSTGPIRGSRLYFLNGRVWWNDPDPSYVRASIPLNHARFLPSWVALSGAFNLNSDWLPVLPAERLDIIKRTLPAHGVTARPVDYFDAPMPTMWLVSDTRQTPRRDVLGLFNWDDKDQSIGCTAAKAGLDPSATYHAFDFWDKRPLPSFCGAFKFAVPGQSCRVIAVRAAAGHPVLVSTSRHVTQGIVDVSAETWNAGSRELAATSQVVGGDPCELRVAGLAEGAWKFATATLGPADQAAGVTLTALPAVPGEDGWLRLVIASPQSRPVRWTLRFAAPN
ncbi:MAG: glycoside hydrolase family 36 protein [Verrucomicrobiota bacterium]